MIDRQNLNAFWSITDSSTESPRDAATLFSFFLSHRWYRAEIPPVLTAMVNGQARKVANFGNIFGSDIGLPSTACFRLGGDDVLET